MSSLSSLLSYGLNSLGSSATASSSAATQQNSDASLGYLAPTTSQASIDPQTGLMDMMMLALAVMGGVNGQNSGSTSGSTSNLLTGVLGLMMGTIFNANSSSTSALTDPTASYLDPTASLYTDPTTSYLDPTSSLYATNASDPYGLYSPYSTNSIYNYADQGVFDGGGSDPTMDSSGASSSDSSASF